MVTTATVPVPRPAAAPTPAAGWDTELFALRGDDRMQLRERAAALVRFLDREPHPDLPALAATLARDLAPGGARLAVVAGSAADLRAKLVRAGDRLADPGCRFVRDAAGVYFTAEPLAQQGTLALLFPGEGAQYPHMLAGLCGLFPEVEETFAWCDRLAADAGRPGDSLRRVLHPPETATPAERAAAETELRKLGPSVLGVLLADLAVARLLDNLRLPVAAVGGHSAGEMAALVAAGAMDPGAVLGPRLVEIMGVMQRQEDAAGGPDVALLAVGAGRAAVEAAAAAVAGGAVVVAMDNCPHQCVAVGPAHLVAAVEAALHERGKVCERLPFRRPYHTPLFEPWMGPFRDLFAGVPFRPPHTPVYSCSTGRRFPADPAAVRELAVNHWVSPVEFAGLVETMYADGVRVFVEAGPRGNLSAFVDDILRGRPFVALPADTPRRAGPTQLNHLVAQLVAHHVPVHLDHLYARRPVRVVEWEARPIRPVAVPSPVTDSGHALPPRVDARTNAEAMAAYLAVMEQFLDVQRDVTAAFLAGRPAAGEPPAAAPAAPPADALIGEVTHHVPGREIVFRRRLDEREDLFAADHTLGGRGVSRVDPGQNGLPILPMTFSLEAMAEAAAALAPGKVLTAIENVRLHRWLPFDPAPTTLEVRATVTRVDPDTGVVEVRADVRDLGNSFAPDAAKKPAAEAVVVLADRYPDPPAPRPFALSGEAPCRTTVADLRRNMFHGPLFQLVRSLDRTGREGIAGTVEVPSRAGWFASQAAPRVVTDPVLVDGAMHLFGAWHLEQPDWTGRILLPFELNKLEVFGPAPPAGAVLPARGHTDQESARHFRHGLEVFGPDGNVWLRLTGAGYWRFYLPFGHVNFFGPKDEYFLSRDWPAAAPPRPAGGPPRRCCVLRPPADLKQPVMRAAGARVTMTPRELAAFTAWAGTDAELNDWFFARLVAKDAVRAAWAERTGAATFPADVDVADAAGGRLVATPRGPAGPEPLPAVAVAAAGGAVVGFAAFAPRVGVALRSDKADTPDGRRAAGHRAVADALGADPAGLTADAPDPAGRVAVALGPALAGRYDGVPARVVAQTARDGDLTVATTLLEAAG